MTLGDLAAALGCPLEGDGSPDIVRVARIEEAGPGDLTFLANMKYAHALAATRASAVIAAPGVTGAPCAVIRSAEPYVTLARAVAMLAPPDRPEVGVHPLASVAESAEVAPSASIGPFAVVAAGAHVGARTIVHAHAVIASGAVVGPDCVLHAHVSIRERCTLGARVVVQDGAVIGSDGFGFATAADGTHVKIPQLAPVIIEDDVEIGANTTIDRPAVGETRVRAGTKIDNLVQIAHGVLVGRNTLLAAQVGIAGSTTVGDSVMLGGQVGVTGHVAIGDRARAVAKTGITNSVEAGAFVSGYPAIPNMEWRRSSAVFRKLPEMRKRLKDLEQRIEELERK
ncbi:MAG: UDP-3-O-(3-hydroxymyristoyl)glucosamine N-acyltransferase [Acidobacteria bacterium]|nr:UDP-3-O-(3-hydroxymyristoyl)glucosamine N-acyltransferase [Acidobacteriota bacterium]